MVNRSQFHFPCSVLVPAVLCLQFKDTLCDQRHGHGREDSLMYTPALTPCVQQHVRYSKHSKMGMINTRQEGPQPRST